MVMTLKTQDGKLDFVIEKGVIDYNMDVSKHRTFVVVNTQKGIYSLKKDFGIDYFKILKENPNIAQAIKHGLSKYMAFINPNAEITITSEGTDYNIDIDGTQFTLSL